MLTVALFSFLQPKAIIAEAEVNRGLRMLTFEGMVGIGLNSITGSGFLAAFALALGANNLQIGILAALPFITQPLQIPVVVLVERLKRRKLITIPSQFASQSIWILMALIPIAIGTPSGLAVSALLALMAIRGVLSALVNTSWNGWLSDLVPRDIMGRFFSQRMALATAVAIVFGLGAGFFVDVWQDRVDPAQGIFAYTIALLVGAIVLGLASPVFMALMPEPLMQVPMGEQPSIWSTLAQPFRDRNFRRLLWFLLLSGFALNMAVPFFAVYMLTRLGLPLTAVIGFTVIGQLSNILFLRLWGPLADRYGSKAILSLCTSLYILVIISWTFTTLPDRHFMTIPLLVVLHIFAGAAVAGVSITIGTLGMKIAPEGQSTSYLAAASLATNVGSGLGPLVGGAFAQFFSVRSLQLTFTWIDPNREVDLPTLSLTGFDFLFAIAFVIGLISLNTLTTIREEGEVSRDIVLDELLNQSQGVTRAMSSVPGLRFVTQFPYSYLRRVPGVDVAVGVTAYQIASLTENAAAAGARSQEAGSTIAGGELRQEHVVKRLAQLSPEVWETRSQSWPVAWWI